jgi:ACR3 family arsenite efflux pump ArsB
MPIDAPRVTSQAEKSCRFLARRLLALMLFVTFLQVPLADLRHAFAQARFLAALLVVNFVGVPLYVTLLVQFLPADPMVRLGLLLVLLTPCIDYVVTFSQLGRGDARLLLAATPTLLIVQMLLLPVYLGLFLGEDAARLVQPGPFVHAFVWLIAVPLALAALVQLWAARSGAGERVSNALGVLPVPATALVLFVVIAAVVPQLGPALYQALRVVPTYLAFALVAPLIGWFIAGMFRLDAPARRSIAFSASTRNSLGPAARLRGTGGYSCPAGSHCHANACGIDERVGLRALDSETPD